MSASRLISLFLLAPALVLAEDLAVPPPGAEPAPGSAPQTYTVQRGDTLWDLSAKFLNSPWYWPKVWSYNPQVANPHWIYPGNVLRFYPGGDGTAPRIEVAGDDDAPPPKELEGLSRADMGRPQEVGEGDDVTVSGPYKIGYVAPKALFARRDSFVTQREVDESGTITAAFEEKLLLSIYDRAYARFTEPAKVKPGATYLLYRTERPVRHPVSGELFGFKSTIIGTAKVVAVDARVATVEIAQAFEPIERGALIGPWTDMVVKQVRRRANGRQLSGFIIAAQQDLVSEIGEHHVVFVDKGRADGVEEGNLFTVVRSGDPYGGQAHGATHDPNLPSEDIGSLLVVDAQQTSSAALVVRSLRELYVGDQVEMRVGATAAR
jgi:LysM domain